jgi:hypothetical protein
MNPKVMHAYVDALDFSNQEFDTAIRVFLQVGWGGWCAAPRSTLASPHIPRCLTSC